MSRRGNPIPTSEKSQNGYRGQLWSINFTILNVVVTSKIFVVVAIGYEFYDEAFEGSMHSQLLVMSVWFMFCYLIEKLIRGKVDY